LPELLLLFADWFAEAELRQRVLSAAELLLEELLSCQFCWADCCCAWFAVLLALTAVLLSTRPAKISLPCEGSAAGLAGRGAAF
jgi:hypothetical protein